METYRKSYYTEEYEQHDHLDSFITKISVFIFVIGLLLLVFSFNAQAVGFYPPVDSGMVAYYHFNNVSSVGENYTSNQTNLVYGYSTNNINGTAWNMTYNQTGGFLLDGDFNFNGVNSSVDTKSDVLNSTQGFSYCAFVNPSTLTGDVRIIIADRQSGNANVFYITNNVPKNIKADIYNSTGNVNTVTSTTAAVEGTSYHLCLTADAVTNNVTVYVNGSAEASAIVPGGFADGLGLQRIGFGQGGSSRFWNGSIDDMIIYNRSITWQEVLNNYEHYVSQCGAVPFDLCLASGALPFNLGNYNFNGSSAGAIQAKSDNIVIDCNGSTFNGGYWQNATNSRFTKLNGKNNVTIKNCIINNYEYGVVYGGTETSGETSNNTFSGNYISVDTTNGANLNISFNTFTNASFSQVYAESQCSTNWTNITINNNNMSDAKRPIKLEGCFAGYNTPYNSGVKIKNNILYYYTDPIRMLDVKNIEITNNTITGNLTLYQVGIDTRNIKNMLVSGNRITDYDLGMYNTAYRRYFNVTSGLWEVSDTNNNVTIVNNNFTDNDRSIAGTYSNLTIVNNSFFNSTFHGLDDYNSGIQLQVTSRDVTINNNNFTLMGSSAMFIQGANNISIINNYFGMATVAEKQGAQTNDIYDLPSPINLAELYKTFAQNNYTGQPENITFYGSLKSSNIYIYNNSFNNATQVYAITGGTTNISTDFSNYWFKRFSPMTSIVDPLGYYISNSYDYVTWTDSVGNAKKINSYGVNGNKIIDANITKSALYLKNVNSSNTYNATYYNLTDALVYTNNFTVICKDILNCDNNITSMLYQSNQEGNTTYVLDNFNLTEGNVRENSPLWFLSSNNNSKFIASNLTSPINTTVVFNVESCNNINNIQYVSNSQDGIYTDNNYSCTNNIVTTDLVDIEPGTANNLLITYTQNNGGGGGGISETNDEKIITSIKDTIQDSKPTKKTWYYIGGIILTGILLYYTKTRKILIKTIKIPIRYVNYLKNPYILVGIVILIFILWIIIT